jgi:hypothetical protein
MRASLLFARSYLSNPSTSVPRIEIQALSLAAAIFYKITSELGPQIRQAYICGDSIVSIHWVNHNNTDALDFFVENRILNIRSKINDGIEELKKTNMLEEGSKNKNFEDTLYWVRGDGG